MTPRSRDHAIGDGEGWQASYDTETTEVCEMQNAETVLGILESKSRENKEFKFDRLYRNFFNPDFYLRAYGRIYAKQGNMTEGSDGETIDGFSVEKITKAIEEIKKESYYFKPARRTYIPKKKNGKRPLGIPAFLDKVVQEIGRAILEAIYEPQFSKSSHGFRPNRSCHTALKQIKREWTGMKWVIEGDIKGFFDNINHEVMIKILTEKIDDGRFIDFIKRMLTAGYVEDWVYHKTYSGTPQGGIISPILANIYLDKLDKFMEDIIIPKYETTTKKRKMNLHYNAVNGRMVRLSKKIKLLDLNHNNRSNLIKEYKELIKIRRTLKVHDPMDKNFIRIKYTRYADDFVIGIIGDKELAETIKKEVSEFLENELNLTLSDNKTLITHFKNPNNPVKFLGYEIYSTEDNSQLVKKKDGRVARAINELPRLRMPSQVVYDKRKDFFQNDKATHRQGWTHLDIAEIITKYSAEIRGLYNYYKMADNVAYQMGKFKYYHRTSLLKTIANKMKISVNEVLRKYKVDDTIGIVIKRDPPKKDLVFKYYNEGFEKNDYVANAVDPDTIPTVIKHVSRNGIIARMMASHCEHCGYTGMDRKYEVHHVRKLKDLKKKYEGKSSTPLWVQQMVSRNRKTLVMCETCHQKLHKNEL